MLQLEAQLLQITRILTVSVRSLTIGSQPAVVVDSATSVGVASVVRHSVVGGCGVSHSQLARWIVLASIACVGHNSK